MKKQLLSAMLAVVFVAAAGGSALAAQDWKFEVVPYLWGVGIDGTLTTRNGAEAKFDRSFSDITSNLDMALEGLVTVQYKRFVGLVQDDYISLSEDEFAGAAASRVIDEVSLDTNLLTLAAGYQFPLMEGWWIDAMAGARFMSASVEVTSQYGGSYDTSDTVVDAIVMVRPNFGLAKWLRFDMPCAIGAGGSDLVYELQPQFTVNFTPLFGVRAGYRYLHYDATVGEETDLDVNFMGPVLGATFTW